MATPEGQILNAILDYLAFNKIWHRRMNTGAIKTEKRFFRFGSPGMADVLAIVSRHLVGVTSEGDDWQGWVPHPVWIEVKTTKGQQSLAQLSFEEEVSKEGHGYLVARSIEDVENYIRSL
jgi:hypothetical protein